MCTVLNKTPCNLPMDGDGHGNTLNGQQAGRNPVASANRRHALQPERFARCVCCEDLAAPRSQMHRVDNTYRQ